MLLSINAHAEFYSCHFTEPFFTVFLTTKYGFATVEKFDGVETAGEQSKIVKTKRNKATVEFKLADGATLTIDRNEVGSDGMSDIKFPFTGTYVKGDFRNVGGCDDERTYEGVTLERLGSLNSINGQSFVNFWPGEYGALGGYRAKVKTTIPAKDTWADLRNLNQKSKDCTIRAKKEIVPIKGARSDIYAYLAPTMKGKAVEDIPQIGVKAGETVVVVTPVGENFCVVEANGKIDQTTCPEEIEQVTVMSEESLPEFGKWAYIRCEEGHSAWIYEGVLFKSSDFEFVQYDFNGNEIH